MVDTKKLISGFLILASILGSMAFIFSGVTSRQTNQKPITGATDNQNYLTEPIATDLTNAFVKKLSDDTSGQPVASIYAPLIIKDDSSLSDKPTSNLTEALSRYVAKRLMDANPDGPTQDSDGQTNIASPPIDDITAAMTEIPEIKNFRVPDWNIEIETAKLAIVNNPSKTDQEKYVEFLGTLFDKYYLQSNLTSVLYKDPGTTPSSELLPAKADLENVVKETKSATIPAPLADFHRALLAAAVYEKNAVTLGANASDDPVKASLVMRAQQKNIAGAISNFQDQFQKSGLQQILSSRPATKAGLLAFLNNLVGVQTAYAQWPVSVNIGMQIQDAVKWITDNIQNILLQILKNMIIMNLQKQVLDWARGGFQGKPAFITNWKGFFQDIGNQAAGRIIESIAPEICSPWRTPLTTRFRSSNGGTSPFTTSCSLSRVISNIEGFYDSFDNGSWLAFGASTLPDGDYFGSILIMGSKISSAKATENKAAGDQAVAGKGFKSKFVCDLGYTQVDEAGTCKSNASQTCVPDESGTCSGVDESTKQGRISTPGDAIGNIITDTGQGSSVKLVVNAQNIIGLITAIAQSLLTNVMKNGF